MVNVRSEVLEEAKRLINSDRQRQYGTPQENFGRIAAMWSAYLGVKVGEADVAVCMALLKAARLANEHKRDSFVDGAGYFALAAELSDDREDM